jgi:hypothetical protein
VVLVKYGRDFCVESWGHEFYMGGREGVLLPRQLKTRGKTLSLYIYNILVTVNKGVKYFIYIYISHSK